MREVYLSEISSYNMIQDHSAGLDISTIIYSDHGQQGLCCSAQSCSMFTTIVSPTVIVMTYFIRKHLPGLIRVTHNLQSVSKN